MTARAKTIAQNRPGQHIIAGTFGDIRALMRALKIVKSHPQAKLKLCGARKDQGLWEELTQPEILAALTLTCVVPFGPMALLIPAAGVALGDTDVLKDLFGARSGAMGHKAAQSTEMQEMLEVVGQLMQNSAQFVLVIMTPTREAANSLENDLSKVAGGPGGSWFVMERKGVDPIAKTAERPARAFPRVAANDEAYMQADQPITLPEAPQTGHISAPATAANDPVVSAFRDAADDTSTPVGPAKPAAHASMRAANDPTHEVPSLAA